MGVDFDDLGAGRLRAEMGNGEDGHAHQGDREENDRGDGGPDDFDAGVANELRGGTSSLAEAEDDVDEQQLHGKETDGGEPEGPRELGVVGGGEGRDGRGEPGRRSYEKNNRRDD